MKRMCLFLVAALVFCAVFTCAVMSWAGPLGIFRNASNQGQTLEQWNAGEPSQVYHAVAAVPAERTAEIARPEDANLNYLTVLGDADEAVVNELRASFPNAHFHHYKSGDPILPRYEKTVGSFPAVVYQQPNGVVISKRSGANFPASARELTGFVEQCRPFRPRPEPTPPVQPTPPVAPVVVPQPVPDTTGDEGGAPAWLYILLAALGAGGGAGVQWYKEIKGE